MRGARRVFGAAFKQEAIELLRRSGKSANQLAKELGINQTPLSRWRRTANAAPPGLNGFQAAEELKPLRRDVARLRMERDILKTAVAFFAKESTGRTRFIQAEKAPSLIEVLCRGMAVARSGVYARCRQPESARDRDNHWLGAHLRACYQECRGR
ncbi:MAG: hypothetical protein C4293_06785 [Nitrospiraceae bacterium]